MVTSGASDLGLDHEFFFQLEAKIFGRFHAHTCELWMTGNVGLGVVVEIINFLERTEILLRRAVTLKAPTHRVALSLIDDLHFIHVAVTALAGNPPVHVSRVVKIYIIRRLVHPHPLDRFAIIAGIIDIHRLVKRRKFRAFAKHMLVTIPARTAGRHVRMTGHIDERVAIAAIQTNLIHVDFMREWNRLTRLVTHGQGLRSRVVGKRESNACCSGSSADSDFKRQEIGPAGKNICHGRGDAMREDEACEIFHKLVSEIL